MLTIQSTRIFPLDMIRHKGSSILRDMPVIYKDFDQLAWLRRIASCEVAEGLL